MCLLCGTTNDYDGVVAQWNSYLFCRIMFLFFSRNFSQPCWHCHASVLITDSNWNKDEGDQIKTNNGRAKNLFCNFLFRFHPPMFIFHTLDCNYNLILCHTEFKSRDIHRIISWKNLIVLLRCDISNFLWTRVRSDNMMIT